jgi:3-phenylpropionate/cinnamic acid dioxygenase small subunit
MEIVTDVNVLQRVDDLHNRYTYALDRLDMKGWLATFSLQGSYELTTQENIKHNLPVGTMLDDCYERLQDRVKYVTEVWTRAVEHYQPRHFLNRDRCRQNDARELLVSTNFSVYYTDPEGKTAPLVVGHYEDVMAEENGLLCFVSKRAIMDTAVPPHYLIYPV